VYLPVLDQIGSTGRFMPVFKNYGMNFNGFDDEVVEKEFYKNIYILCLTILSKKIELKMSSN